jgi:predicted RNA-binding Zn-ribbon protein involved in translation (DUF1610 family)
LSKTNSILTTLARKTQNTNIYSKSGVYQLTCPDCGKAYIGQTRRNFTTRFKEHRNAFRTANQSNSFTKHLTDHLHHFGRMQETMTILHLQSKGTHLNTIERYYIYTEHKKRQLNYLPNKIFDTLIKPSPATTPLLRP